MSIDDIKEDKGVDTIARVVGQSWKNLRDNRTPYDVKAAPGWDFGQPELRHDNEGWGAWESKALQAKFKDSYDTNRQFRYGNWAVHLNGGPQASGESWASISIPVNELTVKDLVRMEYTWYKHVTGTAHIGALGPNFVFSAYDPDNHSRRVDFNTLATENGSVNPTTGWHNFIITNTDKAEHVYWYGNNTGTHDEVPNEGSDNEYFWSDYTKDIGFKDWVIYRVQVMSGYWSSTRSAGDVWIGGLKINGVPVVWEPSQAEQIALQNKAAGMFKEPYLRHSIAGEGTWSRWHHQKSNTGWTAKLYGGVQTGYNDWATVCVPVNSTLLSKSNGSCI